MSETRGWDRFLLGVVFVVGSYGVAMVVAGLTIGDGLFAALGFGPEDGAITSDDGRRYLQLVYGVLGAVIAGWMLLLGMIVVGPLARREPWAWRAVVAAAALWFVLDTGVSLVLGFVGHAAFNVGFGVALAAPLVAIRGEFADPRG